MNFYTDQYCLICSLPKIRFSVDEYVDRVLKTLSFIDRTIQTDIAWMFNDQKITKSKNILQLVKDDIDPDNQISNTGLSITLYKTMEEGTASLGLNAGSDSEWASNNLNVEIPDQHTDSAFLNIEFSKTILEHVISIWHPSHAKIGRSSLFSAIDGGDYRLPPTAGWMTYVTPGVSSNCNSIKTDYPVSVESVESFGDNGSLIIMTKDGIEPSDAQEYNHDIVQRMRNLTSYLFDI